MTKHSNENIKHVCWALKGIAHIKTLCKLQYPFSNLYSEYCLINEFAYLNDMISTLW